MGRYGIIKDRLAHTLPLEAWSDGANVRFYENSVQRVQGHSNVWTPEIDPWWLMPVQTESQLFWMYASGAKVRVVDQSNVDTDITRAAGGDYTSNFLQPWNGGVINGIPVVTNGGDVPQMWNPPTAATKLVALSNWPAGYTARVLRPLREFLVALDITKAGTRYPYNVLWSHPAQPGSVPSTWDVTDTTKDAGEKPLADEGGIILDMVPLKDVGIIYRQMRTHGMQYIGGASVFRLWPLSTFTGVFARHCVRAFNLRGERHFVVTNDDVIVHDGQTIQSVVDARMRRWIFQQTDPTYNQRTHVVHLAAKNEMWIVIPHLTGQCVRAAVWNYADDKWSIRDLPTINFADSGFISPDAALTWDSDPNVWDTDSSAWDDLPYPPQSKRVLMGVPGAARKLHMADLTNQWDGVNFNAFVERVGLAVVAQDPEGNPKFDLEVYKLCTEVYPRLDAPAGAQIDIYVGTQNEVNEAVVWHGPYPFVAGTDKKVNPLVSGKLLGVKFVMAGNYSCRLHGFDMQIEPLGKY